MTDPETTLPLVGAVVAWYLASVNAEPETPKPKAAREAVTVLPSVATTVLAPLVRSCSTARLPLVTVAVPLTRFRSLTETAASSTLNWPPETAFTVARALSAPTVRTPFVPLRTKFVTSLLSVPVTKEPPSTENAVFSSRAS